MVFFIFLGTVYDLLLALTFFVILSAVCESVYPFVDLAEVNIDTKFHLGGHLGG